MVQRHIHYEAAFEDYLRSLGWPYLPVDEQKKVIFAGARVKSFDFLVYPPDRKAWLVDIKGRKFPYDGQHGRRYWENWVTRDDLDGLQQWQEVFGDGFEPILVFAYWLLGPPGREPSADVHLFRDEYYAFVPVPAIDYAVHARQRSPKWDTLTVPTRLFRGMTRAMREDR